MAWDPRVAEELRALREDQERRTYEAYLRRNPDEAERITDAVFRSRVRFVKSAKAFNKIVLDVQSAEAELSAINAEIASVSHGGFYVCPTGALIGGFFSAKAGGDSLVAWLYRLMAASAVLLTGLAGLEVLLVCAVIAVLTYGCIADFSKPLTLSDLQALGRSTAVLREKAGKVRSRIDALNEDRVKAYQACFSRVTREQALQSVRIDHEELPGYIMKEYG